MKEISRLSKKTSKTNLQGTSKMYNKQKGITLIALVITVVILIILATVTLNVVLGEGGLIQRAQQAKELTEQATLEEQQGLNSLMSEYANIMAEDQTPPEPTEQTPTPIEEITKGEIFEETTKVEDATDDTFYVPGGFGIDEESPDEIDDGIVITDGTNEFVWVPVADYTTMYQEAPGTKLTGVETTTDVYSKLRMRSNDGFKVGTPNSTDSREPDLLNDNRYDTNERYYKDILEYDNPTEMSEAFVEEYEATYNSIKKYHGFYVGRYEITGTVESPTVQKKQDILIGNWYNLKKACSNVISSKYAQSTMIYGNQWDEIMSWLITTGEKTEEQINENSTDWGNYNDSIGVAQNNSGILQTSGKSEEWKANNIYDLAGNEDEWTQDANLTMSRSCRGGSYSGTGTRTGQPAADRNYKSPNTSDVSSRPALYIK